MPNWCNNTVQIKGPAKKIQAIKKAMEAGKFLQYLYPMPQELDNTVNGSEDAKPEFQKQQSSELIKKHGFDNWYDWRVDNWGTKWEISEGYPGEPEITKWSKGDEMLNWSFDSAWAPPLGAYDNFLYKNSDVSIFATYYEPGCDFMGVWDSGEDRGYTVGDYDSEDDFWTTEDGQLLDDNYNIVEAKAEWEAEQRAEEEDVTEYVKGNARNLDKLHIGEES
jgi:hypothetical protein